MGNSITILLHHDKEALSYKKGKDLREFIPNITQAYPITLQWKSLSTKTLKETGHINKSFYTTSSASSQQHKSRLYKIKVYFHDMSLDSEAVNNTIHQKKKKNSSAQSILVYIIWIFYSFFVEGNINITEIHNFLH